MSKALRAARRYLTTSGRAAGGLGDGFGWWLQVFRGLGEVRVRLLWVLYAIDIEGSVRLP